MTLIIPGVEIQVIKEIVPQQLNPSGVVAMMGAAEQGDPLKPTYVGSFNEFRDKFGSGPIYLKGPDYSIFTDIKQAFQNGVFEVVVMALPLSGRVDASLVLKDSDGKDTVKVTSKMRGFAGNDTSIEISAGSTANSFKLNIFAGEDTETFDNLVMDSSSENYIVKKINPDGSKLISCEDLQLQSSASHNNPASMGSTPLHGGENGTITRKDYGDGLSILESDPEIDIVMACGVDDLDIHADIDSHCRSMSNNAKGRIGLGTVTSGEKIDQIRTRNDKIASDRFVLVAPYGNLGAVAGLISRLNYYESPTFKPLSGLSTLEAYYKPSDQMELLKAGVVPIEAQRGRGIIVVKGISTSKEQISVTRIADHAVRGIKSIADLFIGTLNSSSGRMALKGKITEFLMRMEREGSIVPSTDGNDPAFLLDVYSSELDFAQGIVRVDMAVRPVRAMDYIYATIKVEA